MARGSADGPKSGPVRLAAAVAILMIFGACGGDGSSDGVAPIAESPAGPTHRFPVYETIVPSGNAMVDAIVELTLSGDVPGLEQAVQFREVPCERTANLEQAIPACRDGLSPGSLVPVLLTNGCHPVIRTPDDIHYPLEAIVEQAALFAVGRAVARSDANFVLFANDVGPATLGRGLLVSEAGIVGLDLACATEPPDVFRTRVMDPVLLPPLDGTTTP